MLTKYSALFLVLALVVSFTGCGQSSPSEPLLQSNSNQLQEPSMSQPAILSEIEGKLHQVKAAGISNTPPAYASFEYTIDVNGNSPTSNYVWYREGSSWGYDVFTSHWYRAVTVTGTAGAVYTSSVGAAGPQYKTIQIRKNSQNHVYQWSNSNAIYIIGY